MLIEISYLLYLTLSVGITVWVARTLSKNGRLFLVRAFGGHEQIADSINHMLVVGFYLVNIGYITLALRLGPKPQDLPTLLEILSTKVGLVMLLLGLAHFALMFVITRWGRDAGEWYAEDTTPETEQRAEPQTF